MDILTEEFTRKVIEACDLARRETLAAGVPVFYRDDDGTEVMEQPDGRRFAIRYISGAPGDKNYEILHEVAPAAA